jgi:hypothetical protein
MVFQCTTGSGLGTKRDVLFAITGVLWAHGLGRRWRILYWGQQANSRCTITEGRKRRETRITRMGFRIKEDFLYWTAMKRVTNAGVAAEVSRVINGSGCCRSVVQVAGLFSRVENAQV